MTEERKFLFQTATQKIALEIMELAMDFPGCLISIMADDSGYFHAQTTEDNKIITYSKTAGHSPHWEVLERVKKEEEA